MESEPTVKLSTAVPAAGYHLCLVPFRTENGDPAIQAFFLILHTATWTITVGCSGSRAANEASAPVV